MRIEVSNISYEIGSEEYWKYFMESEMYQRYFATEMVTSPLNYYIEDFNTDGKYELLIARISGGSLPDDLEDYSNININRYLDAELDIKPTMIEVNNNTEAIENREMNYFFRSVIEEGVTTNSKLDFDSCIMKESINTYEIKRNMKNGEVEMICASGIGNSQLMTYFSGVLTDYDQESFCHLNLESRIYSVTIGRQKNGTYIIDTKSVLRDDLGTEEYWTDFDWTKIQ